MFDLKSMIFGTQQTGLPASLLRPNSGPFPMDGAAGAAGAGVGFIPGLPAEITEQQARENVNAYPGSKRFAANFIEPGPVRYRGQNGDPDEMLLVEADALERMSKSMIGKPVIDWDHADVWPEILGDGQGDGVVYDVWKDENGWWHCGFVLWTKSSIEHAESGEWSVSCAYNSTEEDGTPGRYHSIDYTQKLLNGEYTHLALVKKPRYENARIRANSNGNGGYKMAWELFKRKPEVKKPETLRLNSAERHNDVGVADMLLNVDGEGVKIADLVQKARAARANASAAAARNSVMDAKDEDEVEFDGEKFNVGELRNAHRANADEKAEKEKAEKEKKERENAARTNTELQLKGAGSEKSGKLAGAGSERIDGVGDNPDAAAEAGKEISKLKERLNSLEAENTKLRENKSEELHAAATTRFAPVGGVPESRGFASVEDRIRKGNEDFSLHAAETR